MSMGAEGVEVIHELFERAGIDITPLFEEIIVSVLIVALSIITGWVIYHIFEQYFIKWS